MKIHEGFRRFGTLALAVAALGLPAGDAPQAPPPHAAGGQPLRYEAPARKGPIDLLLRRDGSRLLLLDGGVPVASREAKGTSEILVGGPDRHDTSLTVDYAFGPIPVPIDYHPGALGPTTDNALSLRGGSFERESHVAAGPHSGVITLDGMPIAYSNLTPMNDTTPAASSVVTIPSGATRVDIVSGPVVLGSQTIQINDGGTSSFELLNLANKQAVTVRCGSSTTTVNMTGPALAAGLTTLNVLGGGAAGAVFTFTAPAGATTIDVNGGPVVLGSQTIQVNAGATSAFQPVNVANVQTVQVNGDPSTVTTFTVNSPVLASGLSALNVRGGTTNGNVYNVQAVPAGLGTAILDIGLSTANVGLGGSVAAILGPVSFQDPPSFISVVVDDSADATARTATLVDDVTGYGRIQGLAPADISYKLNDVGNLTIRGGSGGNTFLPPAGLAAYLFSISIDGGSGANTLDFTAVPGPLALNLNSGNVTGAPNLSATGFRRVVGSSGADAFTVVPSATIPFTIDGALPSACPGDSLTVNLAGVTSPVHTPGATGAGVVNFGDRAPVTYTGIESVTPTAATAGGSQTICAEGTTASLGGNAPVFGTGAWSVVSGGTGTFSPGAASPAATFTHATGTGPVLLRWTITTAPCGAATTADVSITVNPAPATPTAGNTGPYCAGGTISLSASTVSGATYVWSGPNGFSSASQSPAIPNATAAMTGTYSVTASVAGCTSPAGTTAVVVNPIPAMPTAGNTGPYCTGGTIALSASTVAGATYAWSGPNGFTSASQSPSIPNATAAMAGPYSVTASVNGCTSPAGTTSVAVNPIPATPTAGNTGPYYLGDTIRLSASTVAGATYAWTGPNGFASSLQNPTIPSAALAMTGTYSVVASFGTGCSSAAATTAVLVETLSTVPALSGPGLAALAAALAAAGLLLLRRGA